MCGIRCTYLFQSCKSSQLLITGKKSSRDLCMEKTTEHEGTKHFIFIPTPARPVASWEQNPSPLIFPTAPGPTLLRRQCSLGRCPPWPCAGMRLHPQQCTRMRWQRGGNAAVWGKNAAINKHMIFNLFNMWPVSVGNLFAIIPY